MPQPSAIRLTPKNFETISLQTQDLMIPELEALYEEVKPAYFVVIRNYVAEDGTKFETWTVATGDWLQLYFEFDETKIETQYTTITRLP